MSTFFTYFYKATSKQTDQKIQPLL